MTINRKVHNEEDSYTKISNDLLEELIEFGYLKIIEYRTESGMFCTNYVIHEDPKKTFEE